MTTQESLNANAVLDALKAQVCSNKKVAWDVCCRYTNDEESEEEHQDK